MELQTLSIKNILPRVPIFARGPFGPLGENGDPREDIFYAYGLQFHFRPPPLFRNYPTLIFFKIFFYNVKTALQVQPF